MLDEKDREVGKARWYHWVRMLMGFKPSPYISVKRTLIVEEIVRGDRHYVDNLSHWTTTRLNLPGSVGYDPSKPWLSKIRADGRVAADLFSFVDDETQKGGGRWKATRNTYTSASGTRRVCAFNDCHDSKSGVCSPSRALSLRCACLP